MALAATLELVLELSRDREDSCAVVRELAEVEVASHIASWVREAHFPVDLAVMVEAGGACGSAVLWSRTRRSGWPQIGAKVIHGPKSQAGHPSSGLRPGVDLTGEAGQSKFVWLPRCDAVGCCVGVRPILENSTACQKSMPSLISVCLVAFGLLGGSGFSLVE